MEGTEGEWRTFRVASLSSREIPRPADEISGHPRPCFPPQEVWVGGPRVAGMLIPVVGGSSLEKGKRASRALGEPIPTPLALRGPGPGRGLGIRARCRKQAAL